MGYSYEIEHEKKGFLCQKHFRVGDVVFGKQSRLLHGSISLDFSDEDASLRMVGVLSAEHENKEGKREEERTRANENVVKELAERNEVRMLKIRMRTKNKAVKNRTEYVETKVRMLEETEKTKEL